MSNLEKEIDDRLKNEIRKEIGHISQKENKIDREIIQLSNYVIQLYSEGLIKKAGDGINILLDELPEGEFSELKQELVDLQEDIYYLYERRNNISE